MGQQVEGDMEAREAFSRWEKWRHACILMSVTGAGEKSPERERRIGEHHVAPLNTLEKEHRIESRDGV